MLFDTTVYFPQELRDYQSAAVKSVKTAWANGKRSPLVAIATGGGKTTCLAQLLLDSIDPRHQRALVIGHTEEIIAQLYERILNQSAGTLLERYGVSAAPGIGIVMADQDDSSARIVVATRQSLHRKRLEAVLKHGKIDVLVIDEAHHSQYDNSIGQIIQQLRSVNPELKLVGLTATPSRGDGSPLASVFDSIAYEWSIPNGIDTGFLVPVTRIQVSTVVNVSGVKSSHGDYNQEKLLSVLKASNWLELSIQAFVSHLTADGKITRKTLAFFPSVEMSKRFTTQMREMGYPVEHLDGETDRDERRRILSRYRDGSTMVIANVAVLTEGLDCPDTSAIFLARPTRSRTLFTQILGRGIRPFPGKSNCLLVDLSVQDTRALEIGDLLGRMTRCEKCSAEHFAGLKACPVCGYVRPLQKRLLAGDGAGVADDAFSGQRLVSNYEALFEKAFSAWHLGDDGFYSCTLGFEDGAFLIVPPLEDQYYRLVHVPKASDKSVTTFDRNEDLASLMQHADQQIKERALRIADKEARWRKEAATLAQIDLLGKLGAKVPSDLSRGAASQIITHHIAVKRLTGFHQQGL